MLRLSPVSRSTCEGMHAYTQITFLTAITSLALLAGCCTLTGPYTGVSGVSKHEKRHILFMAGKLRLMEKGNRIEEGMSEERNSGLVAKPHLESRSTAPPGPDSIHTESGKGESQVS